MATFAFAKLHPDAIVPTRATQGAAAYDLASVEDIVVPSRGKALVSTGIAYEIPMDTCLRITPRSGLASKHGIDIGAGLLDSDYRGEVKVLLFNHSDQDFQVNKGDRIAQMILCPILLPDFKEVSYTVLQSTDRGAGGFGSTGV